MSRSRHSQRRGIAVKPITTKPISDAEQRVLNTIDKLGGTVSIRALSDELNIDRGSIRRALNKLQGRKMVKRYSAPQHSGTPNLYEYTLQCHVSCPA